MSRTTISRKPKDKAPADAMRLVEKIMNKLDLRITELELWKKEQGG